MSTATLHSCPRDHSPLTGAGSRGTSPRTNGSRRRPHQLMDARKVRARLRDLRGTGLSIEQISLQAGVGKGTVWRILNAANPTCSTRTAAALARVQPLTDRASSRTLTDATGSRRRIGDLLLRGWDMASIAAHAGLEDETIAAALSATHITLRVATLVQQAHGHLGDGQRPVRTRDDALGATRARARAAAIGALPLTDWDPDEVDDPSVDPAAHTWRPGPRGKLVWVEDVEELAHDGATWPEVTRRLGVGYPTIAKTLERAGRGDLGLRITRNGEYAAAS